MNIYRRMIVWSFVSTIFKTPTQNMNESDFVKNIKHMNKHNFTLDNNFQREREMITGLGRFKTSVYQTYVVYCPVSKSATVS